MASRERLVPEWLWQGLMLWALGKLLDWLIASIPNLITVATK